MAVPASPATTAVPDPPFVGYHRYRGTVGSQPVTVELTIGPDPENSALVVCAGSYHYDRHLAGRLLLRGPRPFRPGQPLVLVETDAQRPTGRWQASQPIGNVLAGSWHSPAGQSLLFNLREDYTDGQGRLMAVKYEVVSTAVEVPCRPERKEEETKADYRARIATIDQGGYSQSFLHLLGPDTLRPSLQILQCPVPAARREQVRAAEKGEDGCDFYTASLSVEYNDYGLLAWTEYSTQEFITGARPQHNIQAAVYDLRTGRTLRLKDVLRPHTDTLLQRLITRSILRGDNPDIEPESSRKLPMHAVDLAPLSTTFSLTDTGLEFAYYVDEFAQLHLIGGSPIVFSVPVPWAELLPLLLPDSCVARMLRERGLWRNMRKQ
ncbi:MAG: hypothetical protein ACRYG7_22145 [Janthinobacterium lividum]